MHKPPYPSRRHVGTLARSVVMILLFAAWAGALAVPAYAADAANGQLSVEDRELYDVLVSGRKVMQPHRYTTPDSPTVYLTFDDGPSKLTPQVLDILKEDEVKATFFELGDNVRQYPDITQRVAREGHALGNHTYDHVYKSLYGSFAELWRQVQKTDEIFADTVGVRPRLLRAPGGTAGNFDAFYFYGLDQAGFHIFDWNIDSGDSRRTNVPAREIADTVKRGPFAHEMTVLLHDGTGHAETVKALPDIIKVFKEKGYVFAALSERVSPEQFALTKPKWPRSVSVGQFGKLLNDTRSFGALHAADALHADDVQIQPPPLDNDVPLRLRFGRTETTLPPGGYELHGGSLYVPLRLIVETLGGSIAWHDGTRTATVRAGLYELSYDMNAGSIRTSVAGSEQKHIPFADMRLSDGSVIVPLRASLELLGGGVADYSMLPADRHADIYPPFGAYPTFFS